MPEASGAEIGTMGRIAYARIAPNEDLVHAVEAACRLHGFRHAIVRGALGSLIDAHLATGDGATFEVQGPGVEVVSLAGEVRPADDGALRAVLTGLVAGRTGQVSGGRLQPGLNLVCMTFEIALEEWLPEPG